MRMNKQAFSVLTNDEKASLSLQKVYNKSSWQAGEILKKSHYKYLEIKQRAEHFFSVFTNHYNTYLKLVPDEVRLNEHFAQYLHNTIEKRLSVKKACDSIDLAAFKEKKTRDEIIIRSMRELSASSNIHYVNLHSIIMEFDRYNNFRILPSDIQEPSAFKRRNKTRYKKHLTLSVTMHPYALDRIEEIYRKDTKNVSRPGYVMLAHFPHVGKIIRVNGNNHTPAELAKLSLYVFPDKARAEEYMALVFEYLGDDVRDPRKGLLFWPAFRNLIKESLNYDLVNNIVPTRKGLMSAVKDMDVNYAKKRKLKRYQASFKTEEK